MIFALSRYMDVTPKRPSTRGLIMADHARRCFKFITTSALATCNVWGQVRNTVHGSLNNEIFFFFFFFYLVFTLRYLIENNLSDVFRYKVPEYRWDSTGSKDTHPMTDSPCCSYTCTLLVFVHEFCSHIKINKHIYDTCTNIR